MGCVVCEADDLGDADGEEDERGECRKELEDAEDMEDKVMGSAPWGICASIGAMVSH
jgi:hypothetical protein